MARHLIDIRCGINRCEYQLRALYVVGEGSIKSSQAGVIEDGIGDIWCLAKHRALNKADDDPGFDPIFHHQPTILDPGKGMHNRDIGTELKSSAEFFTSF